MLKILEKSRYVSKILEGGEEVGNCTPDIWFTLVLCIIAKKYKET